MATEMPIDPEYGRFVEGIPDEAPQEEPEEGLEVELDLSDDDL